MDGQSFRSYLQVFKETSQFNGDFVKRYNGDSDVGYFLKIDVYYLE